MRKIYVVGNNIGYESWMQGQLVPNWELADLVVFTGGQDVDPTLYGEPRHPTTSTSPSRDLSEVAVFNKVSVLGKHLIGICRGAQFLCVMAGGKLVQHQENHGAHKLIIHDDGPETIGVETIVVSSDHHQAQWPWLIDFRLLGYTDQLSSYHLSGSGTEMVNGKAAMCQWGGGRSGNNLLEVEDAYYPKIKALAIQSHPEWMGEHEPAVAHYRRLLDLHMNNAL